LGTRAERPITFEFRGSSCSFAVRPLTGDEDGRALEGAASFAAERKEPNARPGSPLFDLGLMVHSLALACVDTDSPPEARTPFFTGGAAEILGALGQEDIAFLYARYEAWQAECSPTRTAASGVELVGRLIKIVEDDSDLPFSQLRPGQAWILLRTTAALVLNSPELRSQLTSLFGSPETSSAKPKSRLNHKSTPTASANTK
jgi:hypothetical protein